MYLKDFIYWLVTFLVLWFLWPLIKWFIIIILIVCLALYLYYRYTLKHQKHKWNEGSNDESIYENAYNKNSDVIDVEYKKKDLEDE